MIYKTLKFLNLTLIIKFIAFQLIGLILFSLSIVLFVDSFLLTNPIKTFSYLFSINQTYKLSFPIFGGVNFLFLIIFAIDKFKDREGYGDARFATNIEINNMRDNGLFEAKGTILGLKSGRFIRTNDPLSTLILAPQGTGKTAGIIIPSLLSDTSSYIINDVKGELWDLTSKQRGKYGRVGIFAPSQSFNDGLSWNPLHKKLLPTVLDDQIDYLDRIAGTIYLTEGIDPTAAYFNAEAKALFFYYALKLILENGETSLPEIYRESLMCGNTQDSIAADMEEAEENGKPFMTELMIAANRILSKGENEFGSVKSTFTQALEPFARPNIAKNLIECDFTHTDFKSDKPFSLYIFIPANDVNRMAPIIRVLVGYLVNEFLSLTDKKVIQSQRVVFCMDEFPRMGYMAALKDAPALQRSYNMSTIFVAQDKNQLEKTYGQGSFDYFSTVTDTKALFRQNETSTATKMSEWIGKSTRKKKSLSKKDLSLVASNSISDEGVPLILPQDFMNQGKNEIIILASGHHERPIKAKVAWWFKDKNMRNLVGAYNGLTVSELGLSGLAANESDKKEIVIDSKDRHNNNISDLDNSDHESEIDRDKSVLSEKNEEGLFSSNDEEGLFSSNDEEGLFSSNDEEGLFSSNDEEGLFSSNDEEGLFSSNDEINNNNDNLGF